MSTLLAVDAAWQSRDGEAKVTPWEAIQAGHRSLEVKKNANGKRTGMAVQATTEAAVSAERISKIFGVGQEAVRAVDDVSVAIRKNEFFTLLGPSGCGKTTLLRLIAGFEHPSRGRILLDGEDISALPPYRRPVNTVFQNYALFPHMTVAQNIAFGLEMRSVRGGEALRRVDEVMEMVQLAGFQSRYPRELSGGQVDVGEVVTVSLEVTKATSSLYRESPSGGALGGTGAIVEAGPT